MKVPAEKNPLFCKHYFLHFWFCEHNCVPKTNPWSITPCFYLFLRKKFTILLLLCFISQQEQMSQVEFWYLISGPTKSEMKNHNEKFLFHVNIHLNYLIDVCWGIMPVVWVLYVFFFLCVFELTAVEITHCVCHCDVGVFWRLWMEAVLKNAGLCFRGCCWKGVPVSWPLHVCILPGGDRCLDSGEERLHLQRAAFWPFWAKLKHQVDGSQNLTGASGDIHVSLWGEPFIFLSFYTSITISCIVFFDFLP